MVKSEVYNNAISKPNPVILIIKLKLIIKLDVELGDQLRKKIFFWKIAHNFIHEVGTFQLFSFTVVPKTLTDDYHCGKDVAACNEWLLPQTFIIYPSL